MFLKSQKGSAIIITLMVIVVMSLLGTALWQYSMSSTQDVQLHVAQKQAYYIAKSGADAMVNYILTTNADNVKQYINDVNGKTSKATSLGGGSFTITITRDGSTIRVRSNSDYKGQTANITAVINENTISGFPPNLFANVLFSTSTISLNNTVQIIGTIEAKSTIIGVPSGYTDYKSNSSKVYPEIIFPTNTSTNNMTINNGQKTVISANTNYSTINVAPGGELNFNLSGSDIKVVINSLKVDGTLTVTGTSGHVYLYVKSFLGTGEVNVNYTLPRSSFIVLMPPLSSGGSYNVSRLKGIVYAPGAPAVLGTTFSGAMIAGDITNTGNPEISYASDVQTVSETDFSGVNVTGSSAIQYQLVKWQ